MLSTNALPNGVTLVHLDIGFWHPSDSVGMTILAPYVRPKSQPRLARMLGLALRSESDSVPGAGTYGHD